MNDLDVIKTAQAWLMHYCDLANGLREMISHGRLTRADIPDDFDWLEKSLNWTPPKWPFLAREPTP